MGYIELALLARCSFWSAIFASLHPKYVATLVYCGLVSAKLLYFKR